MGPDSSRRDGRRSGRASRALPVRRLAPRAGISPEASRPPGRDATARAGSLARSPTSAPVATAGAARVPGLA